MTKYVLSHLAIKDINQIWNYTFENWSEKQADFYYNQIISGCKSLCKNPQLGKSYEIIIPNLKGIKINKQILFYSIDKNDIVVVHRILHERMDLSSKFTF